MENQLPDELEETSHGLELQSAILHILDGRRHNIVLSEQTLDLEEPSIEKYVKRYVTRTRKDMRSKPGTFRKDSVFRAELERYFSGDLSLSEYSSKVLNDLIHYFEHEEARSFEALFIDYREDDIPYLVMILLEEVDTLTYMTSSSHGQILNTISFGHTSMPAVSKPVSCFATVNLLNQEIQFVDEGKWKDNGHLIRDLVLDAEEGISRKEVVDSVKTIACEVAEEFHENPTVLLSKVKNFISETVKEGMPLKTETLVSEVFEEKPEMKEVFLRKAEEQILPKEVELPRAAVTTAMRKQRIKTDTGIEISFPAEYFQNQDFIEFVNHSDGTISIEIKQINKITNKL
jgi:nucleoid-associated protein YejK